MSINWVMLNEQHDIIKLPHESWVGKTTRVSLDITTPRRPPGFPPFSLRSRDGELYLSNQRIIYLPAKPTDQFKSFVAPILKIEDTRSNSPFIGAWYWQAAVIPVEGGGIPTEVASFDLKLTFNEGGHDIFRQRFDGIRENLRRARELGISLDNGAALASHAHDEPLPEYEPPTAEAGTSSAIERNPLPPNEPPPDYEEAQIQAVAMQLNELSRREQTQEEQPR